MSSGVDPAKNVDLKSWFSSNWEKVVGLVLSMVVGGVSGFYFAAGELRNELHDVDNKVIAIDTMLNTIGVEDMKKSLTKIENTMQNIETADNARALLVKLLEQEIEGTRSKTASMIKDLLADEG